MQMTIILVQISLENTLYIPRQMAFLKLSPRTSRLTHAITSVACHLGAGS